jgi:hypothetical protein
LELGRHLRRNPYRRKKRQNFFFLIYGTTFRKMEFIPRFSVSPNLFYRSQKPKRITAGTQ